MSDLAIENIPGFLYNAFMRTIAFTGGGTGGHIYPGLAVATQLKKQLDNRGFDYKIFWIGSSSGPDRSIVEDAGIEFFGVSSGKLRRYFSLRNIVDIFKIIGGFFTARKILKKQKANLLFSKGGFVSVPPCAAAASLGIKVFTHESDFSPGLATKINARFVSRTKGRIFTAYEDTLRFFPQGMPKNSIPAPSTTKRSIPAQEPIQNKRYSKPFFLPAEAFLANWLSSSFFNSAAAASPGYICPPVPPPVKAIVTMELLYRNLELSSMVFYLLLPSLQIIRQQRA